MAGTHTLRTGETKKAFPGRNMADMVNGGHSGRRDTHQESVELDMLGANVFGNGCRPTPTPSRACARND